MFTCEVIDIFYLQVCKIMYEPIMHTIFINIDWPWWSHQSWTIYFHMAWVALPYIAYVLKPLGLHMFKCVQNLFAQWFSDKEAFSWFVDKINITKQSHFIGLHYDNASLSIDYIQRYASFFGWKRYIEKLLLFGAVIFITIIPLAL